MATSIKRVTNKEQQPAVPGARAVTALALLALAGLVIVGWQTQSASATGGLGDANKDGTVNAIDAALILQYDAGLVHALSPSRLS